MTSEFDYGRCDFCRRPMFFDTSNIDHDYWTWRHWDPVIDWDHAARGEYVNANV